MRKIIIICPYCSGANHTSINFLFSKKRIYFCIKCKNKFYYKPIISFFTERDCELNNEKHDFSVNPFGIKYCNACNKIKEK